MRATFSVFCLSFGALLAGLGLAAPGCGAACPAGTSVAGERAPVDRALDDWHAAAAASDEARYFELLTDDSVFLGTDATERWDKAAFRAYAHPHFAVGRGWAFRSVRREVRFDPGGRLAWFDEDLATENLGPARGSGVMRLEPDGQWRIVQYNLALTIPNERFSEVRDVLASDPAGGS